jgi:anti-sigma B factor antagonist
MLETPSRRDAHPEPRFSVAVHPDRSQVVVAPSGELDLATRDQVEAELTHVRSAGFTDVVLDLRAVAFIDSSGLQMIVEQSRAARRDDCRFRLIDGPPAVRRLFELTGLADALDFVDGRHS